jgi:hypothetical protein
MVGKEEKKKKTNKICWKNERRMFWLATQNPLQN